MKKNDIELIPFVFFLSSVILVNWSFGQKATFYYLLLILFSMLVYRFDDIKDLTRKKQDIYYPNVSLGG